MYSMLSEQYNNSKLILDQSWADHASLTILWGRGYESVVKCVLFKPITLFIWKHLQNIWIYGEISVIVGGLGSWALGLRSWTLGLMRFALGL